MTIKVKTTNIDLAPDLKEYALEKIGSLVRFLPNIDPATIIAEIELGRTSRHHKTGELFRCEVNLSIGGKLLRAENKGRLLSEAVDKVRDDIERQVRKTKNKRRKKLMQSAREFSKNFKFFGPRK